MKQAIIKSNLLTFILLLLIALNVKAQELSLNDYLALVKKENISLKLSNSAIELAKENSKIAKSFVLPSIEVNGNFRRDLNKNYLFINDPEGGLTRFRTNFNNTINASAVLNQNLFNAEVFDAVKLVKLAEELSKLNHQNSINDIETNAAILYWRAIFIKETISVLEENSALAKLHLDQIKTLFDKGVVSQLELQKFEILYKKTIPELRSTQNEYNSILNDLKLLANIELSKNIALSDDLETLHNSIDINKLKTNISTQSQLKVLEKEVEISASEISSKKKFWLPKLNLSAVYDFSSQDDEFNFNNNKNKLFFAQVEISIPIFSGGKNKAEIQKARIEKEAAEHNYIKVKNQLHKSLQSAISNYNSVVDNIQLYNETILLIENELNILNRQLQLGVITSMELKESRVRFKQAKLDVLKSYLDLHIAKIQIKRLTESNN